MRPVRELRLALLVLLALLLAPGVARADAHRLTQQQVIAIAAADPAVTPLALRNPGSHWEVVYDQRRGTWSAALEVKGGHTVLAAFTIRDKNSEIVARHIVSSLGPPRLTSNQAVQLARRSQRLRDWIGQYHGVSGHATLGDDRVWTVQFDAGDGSEVAEARVFDTSMSLIDVRTGPQVDWQLARGEPDSYGRLINRWWVFLPLCLVFLGGLIDWRRPLSLRTLDLLALLSFGVSLIWFVRGDLFWSTPLVYPPLIYLLARMLRIGFSHRPRHTDIGPTHALILVALTFALIGFRLGLNNQNSNILDVG